MLDFLFAGLAGNLTPKSQISTRLRLLLRYQNRQTYRSLLPVANQASSFRIYTKDESSILKEQTYVNSCNRTGHGRNN